MGKFFSSKCQGFNTLIVTKGSHIITRVFKGAPEVLIRTASLMPVKHTTAHIYFGWVGCAGGRHPKELPF